MGVAKVIQKMAMTEVRMKDETGVVVLPRGELAQLFKEKQVEAVYKYGAFDREAQGQEKAVHDLTKGPYKGYDSSRPRASSVISSQNVDRDGDILRSGGMVISDAYMKGPQVLPMHAREFPIGMTRRIKQLSKSIWAEWEWLVDQEYTQASVFQQAWEAYVLNSTSVGFMPLEMENIPDSYGVDFTEWELLEYSPVVIPANADAMRTDGIKTLLKAFGETVMDGPSPIARRLWEEALAKVSPKQVVVGRSLFDNAEQIDPVVLAPVDVDKIEQALDESIGKAIDEVSELTDAELIEYVLEAFEVGVIIRDEAKRRIIGILERWREQIEEKASQYKREAEDLAARLIETEVR